VPFFGSNQLGDTYYFTPKTVNGLGIVDCRRGKDQLKLYVYGEDEGAKGGNNVASIIIHFLKERGLLDGHKRKKLNIIMDNCGGQNKNRHELRLALYLVHKGCFADVEFMFLVIGHTKNVADCLFNIAKILYRKMNIFTIKKLTEALNHAEQVDCCIIEHGLFRDWDGYISTSAKDTLDSVKKWQIFKVSDARQGIMTKISSNLPDATRADENFFTSKVATNLRNEIVVAKYPLPLYQQRPGLKPIKQMELFIKLRPLIPSEYWDDICPQPSLDVMLKYKKEKSEKNRKKREDSKAKTAAGLAPRKKPRTSNISNKQTNIFYSR
jgi:hypothetical protein